ncbi:hypothetical protein SNEBB_001237 [Seison nebaliae]|nr:hypothetical protein SNEBB_001237 [Seison nebaliae]
MTVLEVFSHPIQVKYYGKYLTKAFYFNFAIILLSFILPYCIIWLFGNPFIRQNCIKESPNIHFNTEMIIEADVGDGKYITFSTIEEFSSINHENERVPYVEWYESETTHEGIVHELKMIIKFPLTSDELEVYGTKIVLYFFIYLKNAKVQIEAPIIISKSDINGRKQVTLNYLGSIKLRQVEPLRTGENIDLTFRCLNELYDKFDINDYDPEEMKNIVSPIINEISKAYVTKSESDSIFEINLTIEYEQMEYDIRT